MQKLRVRAINWCRVTIQWLTFWPMTTYDHIVQSNPNKPLTTNQQSTNNLSTNQHATHQPINTLISYNQLCNNNNNNNNNTQTTLELINKIILYTPQLLKSDKIMSNNNKACKNTGSDRMKCWKGLHYSRRSERCKTSTFIITMQH